MFRVLLVLAAGVAVWGQGTRYGFGRAATADEVRKLDITVFPDGRGLPEGKGTAAEGRGLYKAKCSECHNEKGEGRERQYPALAGGIGTLHTARPVKTVGSYWPYATTVWDYINRSMPFDHPRSLTADEVYSVTAWLLHEDGIIGRDTVIDAVTLPAIQMPNRHGFVPDARPDVPSP